MQNLINIDEISKIMLGLIFIISAIIFVFSKNYMSGDRNYYKFFLKMTFLVIFLSILAISDNLLLFFIAWCLTNLCLSSLMIHKKEWIQAKNSGILALKNFSFGAIFLVIGFFTIYLQNDTISISTINSQKNISDFALVMLIIAAISQSALIPFHKWLLSSLNSPTPVSALMHAGIVNGGGFLLIRFAPNFLGKPILLTIIFILGALSAIIATLWKLMKNDTKGMLACSTIAQMGFMVLQCGLGLFSSAMAHLCLHGLFKSYLFLSFPSAVQDNRVEDGSKFTNKTLIISLILASFSALAFAISSDKDLSYPNTNYVLTTIAFITSAQICLSLLKNSISRFLFPAFILSILSGLIYGLTIRIFSNYLENLSINQEQNLNFIHYIIILLMTLSWFVMIFRRRIKENEFLRKILMKFYVINLNASQANPKTITTYRNHYKF